MGAAAAPEAAGRMLTFCGATVLLLGVVELTIMLCREWQRIGVRILGSWIAASAIMGLTLRLTR